MVQIFIRTIRPKLLGYLTKLLYCSKRIQFGKNLKCDSIPKILVDKDSKIKIGHNVELRRNIELRAHKSAKLILGNNMRIDRGVRIIAMNGKDVDIHDGTRIGLYVVMNGGDTIDIGKNVLISGFVYLQTSLHEYKNKEESIKEQGYRYGKIIIKDDVWIGAHAVILPGTILGKGSIVGSNAVVNINVNQYEIVGGVPAKTIKER
jgi:acetyltransferase-like isoleucine patch superfamily enzyme